MSDFEDWASRRLFSMIRRPEMWGSLMEVELQILTVLEAREVFHGRPVSNVSVAYDKLKARDYGWATPYRLADLVDGDLAKFQRFMLDFIREMGVWDVQV